MPASAATKNKIISSCHLGSRALRPIKLFLNTKMLEIIKPLNNPKKINNNNYACHKFVRIWHQQYALNQPALCQAGSGGIRDCRRFLGTCWFPKNQSCIILMLQPIYVFFLIMWIHLWPQISHPLMATTGRNKCHVIKNKSSQTSSLKIRTSSMYFSGLQSPDLNRVDQLC